MPAVMTARLMPKLSEIIVTMFGTGIGRFPAASAGVPLSFWKLFIVQQHKHPNQLKQGGNLPTGSGSGIGGW